MRNSCLLLIVAVSLVACAPRILTSYSQFASSNEDAANQEALDELNARGELAPNREAPPVLPVTVLEPPPTAAELGEGEIQRSDLMAFLNGGPPQIFQALHLSPVVSGSSFTGFSIDSIEVESGPIAESGLREGDVVTAVNGRDISHVDMFLDIWESMDSAEQLNIDYVRDGRARTLVWHIQ